MEPRGWSWIAAGLAALLVAGCEQGGPDLPKSSLPLMGGYRDADDRCRRVGEDAFTNRFLDDSADLIACPAGVANLSGFGPETGASVVAERDGWVLISVPRR